MIFELRHLFEITSLLRFAGLARSSYYYCLNARTRPDKYAAVLQQIQSICSFHKGRYGYRRVTAELRHRGLRVNHKVVHKLMKSNGLTCLLRLKKYKYQTYATCAPAPNLLHRNFNACAPFRKLVTDITQFSLLGKKVFLAVVLDLFNDQVLCYTIGFRQDLSLVFRLISKLTALLPCGASPVLHSDQGLQFRNENYKALLAGFGIQCSMSRKGNCLDNSIVENFFGILKSEFFYPAIFPSFDSFFSLLDDYILYYNSVRIKQRLSFLSPIQFALSRA